MLKDSLGKKYKSSFYNHFLYSKSTRTMALYNTLTGALSLAIHPNLQHINEILGKPNNMKLRNSKSELFNELIKGGYLVEYGVNEIDLIRLRYYKAAFTEKNLPIILLPTKNCNFRCVYCFENPTNTSMDKYDAENIILFIKNQISHQKPSVLSTTWYGGEPLLNVPIINMIGNEARSLAQEAGISYFSGIITNGYLLNEATAQTLKKLGLTYIQLTIDGPAEIHNKRRPLLNGKPTYLKIKNAIMVAKKYFEMVDVRINVDNDNIVEIENFLQNESWLYGDNVTVRPGRVRDYTQKCNIYSPTDKGLNSQDYYAIYANFRHILESKQCRHDQIFPNTAPVRSYFCGAQILNAYIFGPNRTSYKCTSQLNDGDEIGYLKDGKLIPNARYTDFFFKNHPAYTEPCRSCNLLPLCMGGCPVIRLKSNEPSTLKRAICDHSEVVLKTYLEKTMEAKGL